MVLIKYKKYIFYVSKLNILETIDSRSSKVLIGFSLKHQLLVTE